MKRDCYENPQFVHIQRVFVVINCVTFTYLPRIVFYGISDISVEWRRQRGLSGRVYTILPDSPYNWTGLIILNDFVAEHNRWVQNNEEGTRIDLNNVRFGKELIQSKSLQSSIFEKAMFKDVGFNKCDFTGSYFFSCVFRNCRFSQTILHKCEFHDCDFENATFENSRLTKSEMYDCTLPLSEFSDCDLDWSYISNSDLREVYFNNVTLEGATIAECKLYNTKKDTIDLGEKYPVKMIDIDFFPGGDNRKIVQKKELLQLLKYEE